MNHGKMRVVVLTHECDGENHIFVYEPARTQDVLNQLADYAANPDLAFTWDEAAEVSAKVRKFAAEIAKLSLPTEVPR